MYTSNKLSGFITLPILGAIVLTTIVAGGLGYFIYNQQIIMKENRELREELNNIGFEAETEVEAEVEVEVNDNEYLLEETEEVATTPQSIEIQTQTATNIDSQPPKPVISTINESPLIESKPVEVPKTPVTLNIEKVSADATKYSVTIIWETSIPSDSRLLIYRGGSNEIFPSNNSKSKIHEVIITGLDSSRNYTYELIATADGKEVSKFEKFYTQREFVLSLKETTSDNCFIYTLEDTTNNPLVNTNLRITGSGNLYSERNTIYPVTTVKSNVDGEFKYCNSASKLKVVDSITGEIYYEDK
jgi:hypothetical protein